jgi:hypothetical protein
LPVDEPEGDVFVLELELELEEEVEPVEPPVLPPVDPPVLPPFDGGGGGAVIVVDRKVRPSPGLLVVIKPLATLQAIGLAPPLI